jgi:hypothetical protein
MPFVVEIVNAVNKVFVAFPVSVVKLNRVIDGDCELEYPTVDGVVATR